MEKHRGHKVAREHEARIDKAFQTLKAALRQGKRATKAILSSPCEYQPGTADKIAVMAMRQHLGIECFLEGDVSCHAAPKELRRPLVHAEAEYPATREELQRAGLGSVR